MADGLLPAMQREDGVRLQTTVDDSPIRNVSECSCVSGLSAKLSNDRQFIDGVAKSNPNAAAAAPQPAAVSLAEATAAAVLSVADTKWIPSVGRSF